MANRISTLGLLTALLALARATPLLHSSGGDWTVDRESGDDESKMQVYYKASRPTCGNDDKLSGAPLGLATTIEPEVRRDCDNVINQICNIAAVQAASKSVVFDLSATVGTCEGHFLKGTANGHTVDYKTCVEGFQSVTTTCMLMGDPNVPDNEAELGLQFGVINVLYNLTNAEWEGSTMHNELPGYMMGPPEVFGPVGGNDVGDFDERGTLKPS